MDTDDLAYADEIWKPVPLEGIDFVEVSNRGRLRTIARTTANTSRSGTRYPMSRKQKMLNLHFDKDGYVFGEIRFAGKLRRVRVAPAVCTAFNGPKPSSDLQCAHWDGDKSNNTPANLRWATAQENAEDRGRHGTGAKGSAHGMAKLNDRKIEMIRALHRWGFFPREIASLYGVSRRQIANIVTDRKWTHLL